MERTSRALRATSNNAARENTQGLVVILIHLFKGAVAFSSIALFRTAASRCVMCSIACLPFSALAFDIGS